jgi:ATP-binding cassette, subfamily B, putative efflux pump
VTPLARFLRYARPYLGLFFAAALAGMVKFILPSTMALALKFLTDRLVESSGGPRTDDVIVRSIERYLVFVSNLLGPDWSGSWGQFVILMLTLIVVYALWGISYYFRSYWAQLAGHRVILDLRIDLYQHINRLSHTFFQERQSGGIVSRLMADVALAQNFLGSAMTNIWMDLVTCVFYVYVLYSMDLWLATASLVVFPFYVVSMKTFGEQSKETSKASQAALEEFSGDVQERVAGYHLVKSFSAEKREARSFFSRSRTLHQLFMRNVHITSLSNAVVNWLTQMATLGIIWYGGHRLMKGEISVGTVVAFILLLRELYFPINRISEMNTVLHTSLAAIDRIFEVFDARADVVDPPHGKRLEKIEGRVTFEKVTFGYDGARPVIKELDLDIRPGEMLAVVGPSGAGKSTLVQLVPRFFDPTSGRVLLDGIDLREIQLRSLRSAIGMVAQDTVLFSGSARDNLAYGKPNASQEEIERAARAAHAHEFLSALPEGYGTLLGERGAKLSGGQQQRLALARVFLIDPRILILDEATSALDSVSEALIQESLANLLKGRTSIVIAHRLSTVLKADRIAVMNEGQIVEIGPHPELLHRGGLYAELYQSQFKDHAPA